MSGKAWDARDRWPTDENLQPGGRVMEVLSEHLCQGWLEGYLLTGRHGLFNCYEAFIHIVDADVQPARQVARQPPARSRGGGRWPRSTTCCRRTSGGKDHNGFTHQDPGFLDVVLNKKASSRAGLPAAGRQHAAVGRRPLPRARATTST